MTKKLIGLLVMVTLLSFSTLAFARTDKTVGLDSKTFNMRSTRMPGTDWVNGEQQDNYNGPNRDVLFAQASDDENTPGWSASNASNAFTMYENFSGVVGNCDGIRVWGLILNNSGGWHAVDVDPLQFNVKFWDTANGLPGTELASYTTTVNRVSTGQSVIGFPMYYWHIPVSPTIDISTATWVSINEDIVQTPEDAWFMWFSSSVGDGMSKHWDGTAWVSPDPSDRSLEIHGIIAAGGSPGAPTNFVAVPNATGNLDCNLSWDNPTLQHDGSPLTSLTTMELYRSDDAVNPLHSFTTVTPGQAMNYADITVPAAGMYTYELFGTNTAGDGVSVTVDSWIGEDVPDIVTGLTLADSAGNGVLTWTNPTVGLHGGPYNLPITSYAIVRSDGTPFTVTGSATTWTDTTVPGAGNYYYDVTAINASGNGGTATSNTVLLGGAGLLIFETFDTFPPTGWTTAETNWMGSATNNAGGTAPEADFYWSPAAIQVFRFISPVVNTAGYATLTLDFGHAVSWYSNTFDLKIQTTSDGGTIWNDAWTSNVSADIPATAVTVPILTGDVGSGNFQFAFVFDGDSFDINDWWFDDVQLGGLQGNVGHISGTVTLGTRDITDVIITCGNYTTSPDATGAYNFDLLAGTYDMGATLPMYSPWSQTGVQVTDNVTTTVDITLNPLPAVHVLGHVEDAGGNGLQGVTIDLTGANDFSGTTDASGDFDIDGVTSGETYTLTATLAGFATYTEDITVGTTDYTVNDIVLTEPIYDPINPAVTADGMFTWEAGGPSGGGSFADDCETGTFHTDWTMIQGAGTAGATGIPYWHVTQDYVANGIFGAAVNWGYTIDTWLIAPDILADATTVINFTWESSYSWSVDPNDNADLWIKVSTDGGSTWTDEWTFGNIGVWAEWTWYQTEVDLSAYAGQLIQVAINLVENDAADVGLDDVYIGPATTRGFGTRQIGITYQGETGLKSAPETRLSRDLIGFNVYLDDTMETQLDALTLQYQFTGLTFGEQYTAGVAALYSGNVESEIVEVDFTYFGQANGDDLISPFSTQLVGNYPNPFNPETAINFTLKETQKVTIDVYNARGQKVKTLAQGEYATGSYSVVWLGVDDNNKKVSSGIYFYRMKTGRYTSTKKMILMK
ncbi:MAG: carboxypeptidase regulatory-like domain-containing protein [Candidatus Cloacimonetes bacterium]|nr:carboxypeptidase regulatory-like domain-containing protein [Candidatus Cloacimonadota bacterium]